MNRTYSHHIFAACALASLSCGTSADPSNSSGQNSTTPAPNANQIDESGQNDQITTTSGQAQAYPYAIWRKQIDGGFIVIDTDGFISKTTLEL